MSRGLDIPKASPEPLREAIFDGVENGQEEIFPDPDVGVPGAELAQRCGQGTRASIRCAPRRRARQVEGAGNR